jgi:hypothetical protein
MLIGGLNLPLPNSPQRRISRRTNGTLRVLVDAVQTALVEGVAAEEVDGWEVEGSAAGLAAAGLEDEGLGGEVGEFLLFGGCFGFVA